MEKIDVEREILGQLMIKFELADKFLAQLKESDFSDVRHKYFYKLVNVLVQTNATEFDFS